MSADRIGDWSQVASGRIVYPRDIRAEDVHFEDFAPSLARICRFNGHVRHDVDIYCPTPEQRILTSDLRWVPAGDLKVGDGLAAFDEHPVFPKNKPRRRLRYGKVTAATHVRRQVIRLELEDGSCVRASGEHPWLVTARVSQNQQWMTTRQIAADTKAGNRKRMNKFMEPWETASSRDAGWLAGMADGEGCLGLYGGGGTRLGIAQRRGAVLDEMKRITRDLGFDFAVNKGGGTNGDVFALQLRGGWNRVFAFLGSVRPIRHLSKFEAALSGNARLLDRQLKTDCPSLEVVAAYDEGTQWVSGLETSTRTYFCEGYGAHNSVAEHSVRVARLVAQQPNVHPQITLAALLHDGGESYSHDIIRPILRDPSMYEYRRAIMKPCQDAVFDWACIDIPYRENSLIKWADNVLLATERRDLLAECEFEWSPLPDPLPDPIEWMTMRQALAAFEKAFYYLVEKCQEET